MVYLLFPYRLLDVLCYNNTITIYEVFSMRAVITVVGKDSVGILAKVSAKCAESDVNINEVTQSVLEDMFCMIMMADITGARSDIASLAAKLESIILISGCGNAGR